MQRDEDRREIDLVALSKELARRRIHADLINHIKQVTSIASAVQDLEGARDALGELKTLTAQRQSATSPTASQGIVSAALFAHAILLYTRATDTKPIDRWKWFARDKLSEGERHWHKQVMDYRDKVLAHFGHGQNATEGPTVRAALVLREPDRATGTLEVTYLESRANTRASLSAKVSLLCETTLSMAREQYQSKLKPLNGLVSQAFEADPNFAPLFFSHPFVRTEIIDEQADIDLRAAAATPFHYFRPGSPRID